MNYELALKLKSAGFPQGEPDQYTTDGQWIPEDERQYIPTLEELIKECGDKFLYVAKVGMKPSPWWQADMRDNTNVDTSVIGSTPLEAVAKLWLELNSKEK